MSNCQTPGTSRARRTRTQRQQKRQACLKILNNLECPDELSEDSSDDSSKKHLVNDPTTQNVMNDLTNQHLINALTNEHSLNVEDDSQSAKSELSILMSESYAFEVSPSKNVK
jgi:hypothetical protein